MRYCKFFIIFLFSGSLFSQSLNYRILRNINEGEHPQWDQSMMVVTDGVVPFMIASTGGVLAMGYATHDDQLIRSGYKMLIAQSANILITEGLKRTVRKPRPYDVHSDIICRKKPHGFSFPSGHTSNAFCTATSLTLSTRKWYIGVPAFTYAGLVAYSRMRLGAHYPGDVAMGILVGVGTSLLTWQVDRWINQPKKTSGPQ